MSNTVTDKVIARGSVSVRVYSRNGDLIHSYDFLNLVTSAGKNFLTRKLIGDSEVIESIEIGTGTTEASLTDISIENTVASENIRFQSTENNIASFIATFAEDVPTQNETISEVGLISDNDLLICRAVLDTPFVKATTDYLVINWKLQIG